MTTIIASGSTVATDLIGKTVEYSRWDVSQRMVEARGPVVAVTINSHGTIVVLIEDRRYPGATDDGLLTPIQIDSGMLRIVGQCYVCWAWDSHLNLITEAKELVHKNGYGCRKEPRP